MYWENHFKYYYQYGIRKSKLNTDSNIILGN